MSAVAPAYVPSPSDAAVVKEVTGAGLAVIVVVCLLIVFVVTSGLRLIEKIVGRPRRSAPPPG